MSEYIGVIQLWCGTKLPDGWLLCDGKEYPNTQYAALGSILENSFGGTPGVSFCVPDLRAAVPVGAGQRPGNSAYPLGSKGGAYQVQLQAVNLPAHSHNIMGAGVNASDSDPKNKTFATAGQPGGNPINAYGRAINIPLSSNSLSSDFQNVAHDNVQPSLGLNYIICYDGILPAPSVSDEAKEGASIETLENDILGALKLFAGKSYRVPQAYYICDGSLLSVGGNAPLYSLIQNLYGGTPNVSFALPDLRGRVPIGSKPANVGQGGGEETHALQKQEMPSHNHTLKVSSNAANNASPSSAATLGVANASAGAMSVYGSGSSSVFAAPGMIGSVGNGIGHENRQPYQAIHYIICNFGVYPS